MADVDWEGRKGQPTTKKHTDDDQAKGVTDFKYTSTFGTCRGLVQPVECCADLMHLVRAGV